LNIDSFIPTISPTIEHSDETSVASGFKWFHIQADAQDSKECLHVLGLKTEIIDALCTSETRPKAMLFGDGILVYSRH
jgi:zinc transporter